MKQPPRITKGAVTGYLQLVKSAVSGLTDEEKEQLEQFTPRAKPVQHERAEQEALTRAARLRWWAKGYRHHMAERSSRSEAYKGLLAGVRPGWPDVTLHIPPVDDRGPVLAALELKAANGRPTAEQLECLALLERCGYAVKVGWGWESAYEWLEEQAGPRPFAMPEEWTE